MDELVQDRVQWRAFVFEVLASSFYCQRIDLLLKCRGLSFS
jgi:hypothetical protein